ncbi:MAG: AAA family ATPase [Oligoflexales bacterium]
MNDVSKYWGMKSPLFGADDPTIVLSQRHQMLMDKARTVLRNSADVILVAGANGIGKTTAARTLYANLPLPSQEGLFLSLAAPPNQQTWLLEKLLLYFGIENQNTIVKKPGSDYKTLWKKVSQQFDDYKREGRKLVVVVDNAELLNNDDLLVEIRKLADLKALIGDFISFVFFCTTEFAAQTSKSQRMSRFVTFSDELPPVSSLEFSDLWSKTLKNVGAPKDPFSDDAKNKIVQIAEGAIGKIMKMVKSCLNEGMAQGLTTIDPKAVDSFNQRFSPTERMPPSPKPATKTPPRIEQPPAATTSTTPTTGSKPIDLQSLFYDDEDDAH